MSGSTPAAFAPTRYFTMSDDDKLVAPSFETMDAGLVLGAGTVSFGATTIVPAPLEYASITLNPSTVAAETTATVDIAAAPSRYVMPLAALKAQADTGAVARVPLHAVGRARFRNPAVAPAVSLADVHWRIVQVNDGSAAPIDPSMTTWSEHRAALAALNRGGTRWQMVAVHEIES